MVTIAILGGTGAVGRTLVDAFLADGTYEVVVFARKTPNEATAARTIVADYSDISLITQALEENHVHTVISAVPLTGDSAAQAERNFIAAADKAACTKRFVGSHWGGPGVEDEPFQLPYYAFRKKSVAALRASSLEWTHVHNGFFLDYYGIPHAQTYLAPLIWGIDIAGRTAAIPGTGDETITLTHTRDMAKFVVAAMGLESWGETLSCYGEKTTFNALLGAAEKATDTKFAVTYDSIEKLERGEVTELPSHPSTYLYFPKEYMIRFLATVGIWAARDYLGRTQGIVLNEKFPEIIAVTVDEMIQIWKDK